MSRAKMNRSRIFWNNKEEFDMVEMRLYMMIAVLLDIRLP
jgi:hypothetical protein